jgi:flagellar basal-body rod protein FlgG
MCPSLFNTLYISRQDMLNQMFELDVVSNNLANVNTAGYKRERTNFQELLSDQMVEGGVPVASQTMLQQGGLQTSENMLDWAIQGDGYFPLRLPDGQIGYSRDGHFSLDANGQLVSTSGYLLDWQGQIPADAKDISVLLGGQVQVVRATGQVQIAGTIQLARFANPTGLLNRGNNVMLETQSSGVVQRGQPGTALYGQVGTHQVESSNTDLSEEMTAMVTLQRAFQMSVRALQQTDTMISEAVHMRKA